MYYFYSKNRRPCVLCAHSQVQLFVTPWTVARRAPLSMGFSRQEHWSGLPFPPPGHLPDPGIQPWGSCFGRRVLYHWRHLGGWKWSRSVLSPLFMTPWTVALQAPPSMGFSRQKYWRGSPFPSPGDLPDPGIAPWSPAPQAGFTIWGTREAPPGIEVGKRLSRVLKKSGREELPLAQGQG